MSKTAEYLASNMHYVRVNALALCDAEREFCVEQLGSKAAMRRLVQLARLRRYLIARIAERRLQLVLGEIRHTGECATICSKCVEIAPNAYVCADGCGEQYKLPNNVPYGWQSTELPN